MQISESRCQGTFTGGINPVACGTKCFSCGRAMAEKIVRAAIRIAIWRTFHSTSTLRPVQQLATSAS
jgi:hypothetical protein